MTLSEITELALRRPWPKKYKAGVREALENAHEKFLRERAQRLLKMPCSRTVN